MTAERRKYAAAIGVGHGIAVPLQAKSKRPLRFCFCPGGLGPLDQLRESARILHRKIGENFAVDLNAGGLQPVHQVAVGHSRGACGRSDALDPQSAKLAFLDAAIAKRKTFRAIHRFLCRLVELRFCKEKSFCATQIFFTARAALTSAFNSSHWCSLLCGAAKLSEAPLPFPRRGNGTRPESECVSTACLETQREDRNLPASNAPK